MFWSTLATVGKLMLGTMSNIQLLWLSSLFSAVFLLVVNLSTGRMKMLKAMRIRDYMRMILAGIPGTFLYYIFYYAGAERLLASQAFIVNYLWPIMSMVFACVILKEKMTIRKGVAIALSFAGVIVAAGGGGSLEGESLVGVGLCLAGAVSYGLFTALNQKNQDDMFLSMMLNSLVAFLLTSLINLVNGDWFMPSLVELAGLLWNGIFVMALASILWIKALENGNTAMISNCAYITPFLSFIWTSLVLKEEITIYAVIGLVIIVLGILIQAKRDVKE